MHGDHARRPRGGLRAAALVIAISPVVACAHLASTPRPAREPTYDGALVPEPTAGREAQLGYATWYGGRLAGHRTASGERFDPGQMTAAHRTLPFGTWVEVRRVDTGWTVRVRVTDRGPFGREERIIDLSEAAAKQLGMLRAGVARVEVRVVGGP
jgi:rare lipoprotein A